MSNKSKDCISAPAARHMRAAARRALQLGALTSALAFAASASAGGSGDVSPVPIASVDLSTPAGTTDCRACGTGVSMLQGWDLKTSAAQAYKVSYEDAGVRPMYTTMASSGNVTAKDFGTVKQTIDAEAYRGKRVRLSAKLEARHVDDSAGLWIRADNDDRALGFVDMAANPVRGTQGWKPYTLTMDVPRDAQKLTLGIVLVGQGRLNISDVRIDTVPDTAVSDAAKAEARFSAN